MLAKSLWKFVHSFLLDFLEEILVIKMIVFLADGKEDQWAGLMFG